MDNHPVTVDLSMHSQVMKHVAIPTLRAIAEGFLMVSVSVSQCLSVSVSQCLSVSVLTPEAHVPVAHFAGSSLLPYYLHPPRPSPSRIQTFSALSVHSCLCHRTVSRVPVTVQVRPPSISPSMSSPSLDPLSNIVKVMSLLKLCGCELPYYLFWSEPHSSDSSSRSLILAASP
jgi:hypothetical protein